MKIRRETKGIGERKGGKKSKTSGLWLRQRTMQVTKYAFCTYFVNFALCNINTVLNHVVILYYAVTSARATQSYAASPAIWDHIVLPATWHRWTRPASTTTRQDRTRL